DTGESQAQLHHGKSDLGLNADDDRLGPTESDHVGEVADSADGQRVHYVERRDVDDDSTRAKCAYLCDQGVAQLQEIGIGEGGLNTRNQIVTLLQDGYLHSPIAYSFCADSSSSATLQLKISSYSSM